VNGKPAWRRRVLNFGLAVLGFTLVCACLYVVLPFPEIGVVAARIRYFKKHGDQFDTLFVGSSLTHHDIAPSVFDRVMEEGGHPTRSFNFGVDGMLVAESSYVLERLMAARPNGLKWVFIELDELAIQPFAGAEGSRRDIYWRDAKRTSLLLAHLFEDRRNTHAATATNAPDVRPQPSDKHSFRELLFFHLGLFGKNITNVSRRSDLAWWASHFWKPDKMPEDLGPEGDGYAPFAQDIPESRLLAYQFELDQALAHPGERVVSAATERACREMAEQVTKVGATPIFVRMPVVSQVQLRFRSDPTASAILSYNNAAAYPELYRRDTRAEEIHLNPRGAEALSSLVARDLSKLIDQRRPR
jgi:hypothetical protein